jgi:hypothetical protein
MAFSAELISDRELCFFDKTKKASQTAKDIFVEPRLDISCWWPCFVAREVNSASQPYRAVAVLGVSLFEAVLQNQSHGLTSLALHRSCDGL